MQTTLYMLADFNIPLMLGQEHCFFAASRRKTAGFTVLVFLDAGEIIQYIHHSGGRWLPLWSFPAVQKSVMFLKALTEESKAVNHLERQDKTSDDTKLVRNNMTNSYSEEWRSQCKISAGRFQTPVPSSVRLKNMKGGTKVKESIFFACVYYLIFCSP